MICSFNYFLSFADSSEQFCICSKSQFFFKVIVGSRGLLERHLSRVASLVRVPCNPALATEIVEVVSLE